MSLKPFQPISSKRKSIITKVRSKLKLANYWWLLIFGIIGGILGYIEYGVPIGAVAGFFMAFSFNLITLIGLVPFAGPFLYWYVAHWLAGNILGLAGGLPIGLVFWGFLILNLVWTVILCGIITFIAVLVVLAAIFD